MNELCELKGHMWYFSDRININMPDGVHSIATKRKCARCLEEEDVNLKLMYYSEKYWKVLEDEHTTIRRHKKADVGDICLEIFPGGSQKSEVIKVEGKTLDELDDQFLFNDTDRTSRKEAYELIQSFYEKPIDFKNEKFYIYYLKRIWEF